MPIYIHHLNKSTPYWELQDIIHSLYDHVKHLGSQAYLAGEIGISDQYLSDVLNRKRDPGKKILDYLQCYAKTIYLRKD